MKLPFIPFFRLGHLLIDAMLILLVYVAVFNFRFEGHIPQVHIHQYWLFLPIIPFIRLVANMIFGVYAHIWGYVGIREMMSLLRAVSLGSLFFIVLVYLAGQSSFPRSIFIFEWAFTLIALGGVRFSRRFAREMRLSRSENQQRALIVGAGDMGEMLVRDMLRHPQNGFLPVVFIDDDPNKRGSRIHGIPVGGDRTQIPRLVEMLEIDVIVIAINALPHQQMQAILEISSTTSARIQIVPALHEIINGNVSVSQLRNIQIEDLLGRDPVIIDDSELHESIGGKVVLVTGAGGSIGSELCRQITRYRPSRLILLGHGENSIYLIDRELAKLAPDIPRERAIADIRDRDQLERIFTKWRPQIVYHAAAHKHVPLMQENLVEAISNNVGGTRLVSEMAEVYGVEKFINISTDKAVNPTSIMGLSKRTAELAILLQQARSRQCRYITVRFGNVIGSRGSVIPLFHEQIAKGGPVTVTHPEMTRYFMTIPEAAQLVLQAGSLGEGGEIFLLDMGEPVKIVDLAKNMIKLSGYSPEQIPIAFSGLRPGEKLYEELLIEGEGASRTRHSKIFRAKSEPIQVDQLEAIISQLCVDAKQGEQETVMNSLVHLIPTYQGVQPSTIVRS